MSIRIVHATLEDLPGVMAIELSGFDEQLAASRETYRKRIEAYADTFLVAKDSASGEPVGFICGPAHRERFVQDQMYEIAVPNPPHGGHQLVLTVAVLPHWRQSGIAGALLDALAGQARRSGRESIALTCLKALIPFYERNGYTNVGVAASSHGDRQWFNMEKRLDR